MNITLVKDGSIALSGFIHDKYHDHYISQGYQIFEGSYPIDKYEFVDGEFVSKLTTPTVKTIGGTSNKELIRDLLRELGKSGNSVPMQTKNVTNRHTALKLLNQYAGMARANLISDGFLTWEEYAVCKNQIVNWRSLGSPSGQLPSCISGAWVSDYELEAQAIEAASLYYDNKLIEIRNIRKDAELTIKLTSLEDLPMVLSQIKTTLEGIV